MCPNLSSVKFPYEPIMLTDTPSLFSREAYTIYRHRAAFPLATRLALCI